MRFNHSWDYYSLLKLVNYPPPFFHWGFSSIHFLLLFLLVFPTGVWAQGYGNLQSALPQNLVEGRNQIDLSQDFPVNRTAMIFKEHGSSGDIPSEHSLEDDGNGTDAVANVGGSEEIHVMISPNVDPPDPPSYLEAFGGPSWTDLYWRAPDDNGGSAITGYRIEASTDGGDSWGNIAAPGPTVTKYTHSFPLAGTTYHYRVRAINDDGNSDWSNVASAIIGGPGNPILLNPTTSGRNQIALDPSSQFDLKIY